MFIKKIILKNYRNLKEVFLEFSENINILIGYNGQGKTNLLEAIYLLATGSSHRTSLDRELITWEKDKALVQLLLFREEQTLKLSLKIAGSSKLIEINNTPAERVSELIGNLNVVFFSPEGLNLVKGGPVFRRRFLDIEISQISSYYFYLLNKYRHVLKQRNNLLKDLREGKGDRALLEIWDEKLIELGSKIIDKRKEVVEKIKILARLKHRQITNGNENLTVEYETIPGIYGENKETEVIFKHNLVNNREEEIKRGYTLVGPHRDDLSLKINEIDLRKYGSQGQQRTAALALKLAELELMKAETGEYPILLLDDVFSELDQQRRLTLLRLIADKIQTFITTTDLRDLGQLNLQNHKVFIVNKGKIKER